MLKEVVQIIVPVMKQDTTNRMSELQFYSWA